MNEFSVAKIIVIQVVFNLVILANVVYLHWRFGNRARVALAPAGRGEKLPPAAAGSPGTAHAAVSVTEFSGRAGRSELNSDAGVEDGSPDEPRARERSGFFARIGARLRGRRGISALDLSRSEDDDSNAPLRHENEVQFPEGTGRLGDAAEAFARAGAAAYGRDMFANSKNPARSRRAAGSLQDLVLRAEEAERDSGVRRTGSPARSSEGSFTRPILTAGDMARAAQRLRGAERARSQSRSVASAAGSASVDERRSLTGAFGSAVAGGSSRQRAAEELRANIKRLQASLS